MNTKDIMQLIKYASICIGCLMILSFFLRLIMYGIMK